MRTVTGAHRGEHALVAPTLIQRSWGERPGQAPRCLDIQQPLGTIVSGGVKHALVSAFLAKHYSERASGGWNGGSAMRAPVGTVTARDHHALVAAFLTKYYSSTTPGQDVREPLHTITALPRFGLVTVAGESYTISDIGMRMLVPRELYRAQGFPDSYRIEVEVNGKVLSKGAQVRMCGNSVPPPMAAAIVRANYLEAAEQRRIA
jgi:DNA (cytosine-5)-methyltransferase 1